MDYYYNPHVERRSRVPFADPARTGFMPGAITYENIATEGIRSGRYAAKKEIKLKDVLKAVGQAAVVAGGAMLGAVAADQVMDSIQGGSTASIHIDDGVRVDLPALISNLPSHNVVYAAADHPTIVNRISHILSSVRGGDEAIEVHSPRKRYHGSVQAAPALQSAECQTADAVGQRENPSQVFYKINPENCVVDAIKLISLLNIDGYSKLSVEEQERYLTRTLGAKKSADGRFYIFVNGDKEIIFKRPGTALEVDIGFHPVAGNYFEAIINAGVFRSALEKSLEPSSKYITPVYPTPTQDKGFIFGDWLSGDASATPEAGPAGAAADALMPLATFESPKGIVRVVMDGQNNFYLELYYANQGDYNADSAALSFLNHLQVFDPSPEVIQAAKDYLNGNLIGSADIDNSKTFRFAYDEKAIKQIQEMAGGNGQDVVDFFILPAIGAVLLYSAWIFKKAKLPDYIRELINLLISKFPKKS